MYSKSYDSKANPRLLTLANQVILKMLYLDSANLMFHNVKDGACHLGAGNYRVSYKTTQPLRKVYSTALPIRELMANPKVCAALEKTMPHISQIPVDMWKLSLREISSHYGGASEDEIEAQFAPLDAILAENF